MLIVSKRGYAIWVISMFVPAPIIFDCSFDSLLLYSIVAPESRTVYRAYYNNYTVYMSGRKNSFTFILIFIQIFICVLQIKNLLTYLLALHPNYIL